MKCLEVAVPWTSSAPTPPDNSHRAASLLIFLATPPGPASRTCGRNILEDSKHSRVRSFSGAQQTASELGSTDSKPCAQKLKNDALLSRSLPDPKRTAIASSFRSPNPDQTASFRILHHTTDQSSSEASSWFQVYYVCHGRRTESEAVHSLPRQQTCSGEPPNART